MSARNTILHQHPTTLLGLPLTTTQQVTICFLVPAIANCLIFITDFASNIAVIERHFQESNVNWALSSLFILYIPSYVYFALTVSNVKKWNDQPHTTKATKWFLYRLLQFVIFPVWGIYRYAKVIFWSIEALLREGPDREEAVQKATRPSYIELYLFLQAYLQGIPQALLQLTILFNEHDDKRETDSMQVLCIASSLMLTSTTTVSFQRFESQKALGRTKPWEEDTTARGTDTYILETNYDRKDEQTSEDKEISPPRHHLHKLSLNNQSNEQLSYLTELQPDNSNTISRSQNENTDKTTSQNHQNIINNERYGSDVSDDETSTPYLQPRIISPPHQKDSNPNHITSSESSSISSQNHILDVFPTKTHALYAQTEQNNPIQLSSTTPHHTTTPSGKIIVQGMEQDELSGKCVSFLMWFFFLLCRITAIVSFTNFFPKSAIGFCIFHYLITLFLLQKYSSKVTTILTRIYLAFVYFFCLIELKLKFKKASIIYATFFTTVSIENIIISSMWYVFGEWDGWWYNYTYFLIWGSLITSIMSLVLYIFVFKPRSQLFLKIVHL